MSGFTFISVSGVRWPWDGGVVGEEVGMAKGGLGVVKGRIYEQKQICESVQVGFVEGEKLQSCEEARGGLGSVIRRCPRATA